MKQKRALLAVGKQSVTLTGLLSIGEESVTLVGKIPIGGQSLKVTSYPSNEFDDELIKEEAKKEANNNEKHSHIKLDYQDGIYYGFITGAKWMKQQILKKNK